MKNHSTVLILRARRADRSTDCSGQAVHGLCAAFRQVPRQPGEDLVPKLATVIDYHWEKASCRQAPDTTRNQWRMQGTRRPNRLRISLFRRRHRFELPQIHITPDGL